MQVLEETGLDISGGLRESDFIDVQLGDQDTRLFIVQVWEAGRAGLGGRERKEGEGRGAVGRPGLAPVHRAGGRGGAGDHWNAFLAGLGGRERREGKGGAAAACIAGLDAEGARAAQGSLAAVFRRFKGLAWSAECRCNVAAAFLQPMHSPISCLHAPPPL